MKRARNGKQRNNQGFCYFMNCPNACTVAITYNSVRVLVCKKHEDKDGKTFKDQ